MPFIHITSERGSIGRITWDNSLPLSDRTWWGDFWFSQNYCLAWHVDDHIQFIRTLSS